MSLGFSHKAILTALANILFALPAFNDSGRRVPPWSKVKATPGIYLRGVGDEDKFEHIILSATTIKAEVWIYSQTDSPDGVPGDDLHDLVDQVRAAFKPDKPQLNTFTLGGRVQHCWIEGESVFDPGDLDAKGRSRALIPVRILVP